MWVFLGTRYDCDSKRSSAERHGEPLFRVRKTARLRAKHVMICIDEETMTYSHAMAGVGGRRQAGAGNNTVTGDDGVGKGLLPEFPGEAATKAAKQRWCRESRRKLPAELQTVLGGRVPRSHPARRA